MKYFKIALLIFLLNISYLNAAEQDYYIFTVDNPSMVHAYFNIFNAMAGIFNSPSYMQLLKLSFLIGGFITFTMVVLRSFSDESGIMKTFPKYMLIGTSLLVLLFSHKSDILIKTTKAPSYCNTDLFTSDNMQEYVSNIPTTLAWFFSSVNTFSNETVKLANTGFSNVNTYPITSTRSDYVYYLSNIKSIMNMSLDKISSNTQYSGDTSISSYFEQIMSDCVIMPTNSDSVYGPLVLKTIYSTGDLQETLEQYINNGKLVAYNNTLSATTISIEEGVTINGSHPGNLFLLVDGQYQMCSQAWNDLKVRLNDLKGSKAIECYTNLNENLDANTLKILTGYNFNSTDNVLGIGRNIAMNSALMNSFSNVYKKSIIAGEFDYAAGKTMSELAYTSIGQGYFMAEMLPYLQMGMRAILYAFFPFVFIVGLFPGGLKVLGAYFKTLIWVELWAPAMAVLNMFLSYVSQNNFSQMFNERGMNILNGSIIYNETYMLAGMAGYLFAFIPPLTWLLLEGSADMINNITAGLTLRMSANMDSDKINQDLASQSKVDMINSQQRANGKELLSMAEIDNLSSKVEASQKAGEWVANVKHMDKIMKAAEGNKANEIAKDLGVFNAISNFEKNGENAVNTLSKGTELKTITSMETTNKLDLNKNMDLYSNVNSNEKVVKILANEKKQDFLKSVNGLSTDEELNKKISEIQGLTKGEEIIKDNFEQQTISKLTGKSVEESIDTMGAIKANVKAVDEWRTQAYQIKLADIHNPLPFRNGANLNINLNYTDAQLSNLQKFSKVEGTKKAIETSVSEKVLSTVKENDILSSRTNLRLEEIGLGLFTEKNLKTQLDMHNKDTGKNIPFNSIKDAAFRLSQIGKEGDIFTRSKSDNIADESNKLGYNSNKMALIQVSESVNELLAKNALFDSYRDMQKKFLNLNAHEYIGDLSKNDKSNFIDKAISVDLANQLLGMHAENFKTLSSYTKMEAISKNGITAERFGKSSAFEGSVNVYTNELHDKFFSSFNNFGKDVADAINDIPFAKEIAEMAGLNLTKFTENIKNSKRSGAENEALYKVAMILLSDIALLKSLFENTIGDTYKKKDRDKLKKAKEAKLELKAKEEEKAKLKEIKNVQKEKLNEQMKKFKEKYEASDKVINDKIDKLKEEARLLESKRFYEPVEEKYKYKDEAKKIQDEIKEQLRQKNNLKIELDAKNSQLERILMTGINSRIELNKSEISALKDTIYLNKHNFSVDKEGNIYQKEIKGNFLDQLSEKKEKEQDKLVKQFYEELNKGEVTKLSTKVEMIDREIDSIKNSNIDKKEKQALLKELFDSKSEIINEQNRIKQERVNKMAQEILESKSGNKYIKAFQVAAGAYLAYQGVEVIKNADKIKDELYQAYVDKNNNGSIDLAGTAINIGEEAVWALGSFNPAGLAIRGIATTVNYGYDEIKTNGLTLDTGYNTWMHMGNDFKDFSLSMGKGATELGLYSGILVDRHDYTPLRESRDLSTEASKMISRVNGGNEGLIGNFKIPERDDFSLNINREEKGGIYKIDILNKNGDVVGNFKTTILNDSDFAKDGFLSDIRNNVDHAQNFNKSLGDLNKASTLDDFKKQFEGAVSNAKATNDYGFTTLGKIKEKINETLF